MISEPWDPRVGFSLYSSPPTLCFQIKSLGGKKIDLLKKRKRGREGTFLSTCSRPQSCHWASSLKVLILTLHTVDAFGLYLTFMHMDCICLLGSSCFTLLESRCVHVLAWTCRRLFGFSLNHGGLCVCVCFRVLLKILSGFDLLVVPFHLSPEISHLEHRFDICCLRAHPGCPVVGVCLPENSLFSHRHCVTGSVEH